MDEAEIATFEVKKGKAMTMMGESRVEMRMFMLLFKTKIEIQIHPISHGLK